MDPSSSVSPVVCLQVDGVICQKDFQKIKAYIEENPKAVKRDQFDSAEDAANAEESGLMPDIQRIMRKADFFNSLETVRILKTIVDSVARSTASTVYRKIPFLGVYVTMHKQYLHPNHNLHQDISLSMTPTMQDYVDLAQDPDFKRDEDDRIMLSQHSMFPLTLIMYLTETDTPAPPGMATTSVAPVLQTEENTTKESEVYTCTFANGGISVFPGNYWHAVAPNPYFERATVALKVLLLRPRGKPFLTWEIVKDKIESNFRHLLQENGAQRLNYHQTIEQAQQEHKTLAYVRPYTIM